MLIDPKLWTLQICGKVSVFNSSERIDRFPTKRAANLLIALGLARDYEMDREELSQILWSDEIIGVSRTLLRNDLVRLRKSLGGSPNYLQSSKSKIWLDPGLIRVDLDVAEQALSQFDPSLKESPDVAEQILVLIGSPVSSTVPSNLRDQAERRRQKLYRSWLVACAETHLLNGKEKVEYYLELAEEHSPQNRRLQYLVEHFQRQKLLDSESGDEDGNGMTQRSATSISGTIPQVLMPIYGRNLELETLLTALDFADGKDRLVSIRGMGGMGKTRLAIEVANTLESQIKGRVWFIDATNSVDRSSLLLTICDQLEIKTVSAHRTLKSLTLAMGQSQCLLVIDNCEQLDQSSIRFIEELVESHSDLKVLCTTRRKLGIHGEREIELPPVSREAAIKIYLHNFNSDADFSSFEPLIDLLEGIPLAIQLASAYREILSPKDSILQLEKRFAFLVDPAQVLPERHRRLWDTIDWSVQLLDDESKQVLLRLSVFTHDWTIEAAEQVLGQGPIYRAFERLVSSSLLSVTTTKTGRRFSFLESVREYCETQLESEIRDDLAHRHFNYFFQIVREKFGSLSIPKYYFESRGGAIEYPNIQSALRYGIENEDPRTIEMVHLLGQYWVTTGKVQEGISWYQGVMNLPIEPSVNSLGLYFWAGLLARNLGTFDIARSYFERAIAIGEEIDDVELSMITRGRLAELLMIEGQYRKSNQLSYECLEAFDTIGGYFNQTFIYEDLALSHCALGETSKAIEVANLCYETRMNSQHGPLTQGAYRALGRAHFEQGEMPEARYYFDKARTILSEADLPLATCRILEDIVALEIEVGTDEAIEEIM